MDYATGAVSVSPTAGAAKDPTDAVDGPAKRIEGDLFIRGQGDSAEIDPNDVRQGALGDCYLMAALMSVARTDPQVIRKMVRDNGNGTYTVRFRLDRFGLSFLGKETKEVTVDARVPTGANDRPRYAQTGDERVQDGKIRFELWALIVEKAWAKLKGGYPNIAGGNPGAAMEAITGEKTDRFDPRSKSDRFILARLKKAQADGHPVTCSTPKVEGWKGKKGDKKRKSWNALADQLHVYAWHAYSFKAVKDEQIVLENPWGYDHPMPMTPGQLKQLFVEVSINRA